MAELVPASERSEEGNSSDLMTQKNVCVCLGLSLTLPVLTWTCQDSTADLEYLIIEMAIRQDLYESPTLFLTCNPWKDIFNFQTIARNNEWPSEIEIVTLQHEA